MEEETENKSWDLELPLFDIGLFLFTKTIEKADKYCRCGNEGSYYYNQKIRGTGKKTDKSLAKNCLYYA